MSQSQIVKGIDDIKMTGYVKLKKYYDKIVEKLQFIVSEAIRILPVAAFFAAFQLSTSWIMLGVQPLKLYQIIYIVSVLSATIVAFRVPVWFPNRSGFMVITCEIIVFSLSEVAVFVPITMNIFWFRNYLKESGNTFRLFEIMYGNMSAITVSIMSLIGYVWVLLPLMNTVLHSAFIHHLMLKSEYTSGTCRAAVRGVYYILGPILIYGSMLGLFLNISQSHFLAFTFLLPLQVMVFIMFMMYVQVFVGIMKTGKEVKFMKLISLYTHPCRIIVFTVMMPILITFVVMLTKYDGTLLVEDVKDLVCKVGHMIGVKNHQQTAEFTEFSIVWSSMSSITMALCWSLCRDVYLQTKTGLMQLTPNFLTT